MLSAVPEPDLGTLTLASSSLGSACRSEPKLGLTCPQEEPHSLDFLQEPWLDLALNEAANLKPSSGWSSGRSCSRLMQTEPGGEEW